MIKPTIGRVVWYNPAFEFAGMYDPSQPLTALICFVYSDTDVNLAVFDNEGNHYSVRHVPLYQGEDDKPTTGHYCEWMPYQVGQAKAYTTAV